MFDSDSLVMREIELYIQQVKLINLVQSKRVKKR